MQWRCWMVMLTISLPPIFGCGGAGDIASVEGTVTLDGAPLPGATVLFVPEAGGRPAAGRTDDQGKYVLNFSGNLKGAIPGKSTVRISTKADTGVDDNGQPIPAVPEKIPMKYNVKSELSFEVVDGTKNVANFELDSSGTVVRDEGY